MSSRPRRLKIKPLRGGGAEAPRGILLLGGWRGRPFEFVRKSQNDYVLSSFTNDEISSLKFELSRVKRATFNGNFGLVNLTMKSHRSNLSSRSVWFSFIAKSSVRGSRKYLDVLLLTFTAQKTLRRTNMQRSEEAKSQPRDHHWVLDAARRVIE